MDLKYISVIPTDIDEIIRRCCEVQIRACAEGINRPTELCSVYNIVNTSPNICDIDVKEKEG